MVSKTGHFHKDNGGFSLVEIIVVSVIIAILAAVAIPMYGGYVRDQRQTTVDNLAETAAAAANAYVRRTGDSAGVTADKLNLYMDTASYTLTITTGDRSITVTDKDGDITSKTTYY